MIDPSSGPYLFDTSAESWFVRHAGEEGATWLYTYLGQFKMSVSAITVTERVRGYSILWRRAAPEDRARIESARIAYLNQLRDVLPIDQAVAIVSGEIIALLPVLAII